MLKRRSLEQGAPCSTYTWVHVLICALGSTDMYMETDTSTDTGTESVKIKIYENGYDLDSAKKM